MALPAFAFSGFIHATFLCISTWFHSKSMMLERRSPVTSAKVTIGLMLSEQHSINRFASSLVSQRIRLLTGFLVLITGAFFIWSLQYVATEYERGTLGAYTNLSVQSPIYASQTTLSALLSSPAYQNQVAAAFVSTYSDWKGISDAARTDLANIIADAVGRGVTPRETMKVISKRLNVSMSKAKKIAQTEQVGALREAQWNETTWAQDRLGLRTKLLHLSALKPTTRTWHASRHGKLFTVEEVREWYSKDGNRFNCYCSQVPAILNDNGEIVNKGLVDRLAEERKSWQH